MRTPSFALSALLCVLPCVALAQALDPSAYSLTAEAAEKFVRATQQMVSSGAGPSMQGNGTMDLERVKSELDRNPAAHQALAAAGMTSADYALFMGAAMQAMMVGQMEQAGMRGMLPPGVSQRPSQANIDFMRANLNLFERAVTPGASASIPPPRGAQMEEEPDLPVPDDALAVLASSLLDRLPRLDSITRNTMCEMPDLMETVNRERERTAALHAARYGRPGSAGLARTPAEGAVLQRADEPEIDRCGELMSVMAETPEVTAAAEERSAAHSAIELERQEAWAACPGIPGGKEPECERRVAAEAAAKYDAAERRYLAAIAGPYAGSIAELKTCAAAREALVRDAQSANVIGANVKRVLRPLTMTWDVMPFAVARWSGLCEDSKRYLGRN